MHDGEDGDVGNDAFDLAGFVDASPSKPPKGDAPPARDAAKKPPYKAGAGSGKPPAGRKPPGNGYPPRTGAGPGKPYAARGNTGPGKPWEKKTWEDRKKPWDRDKPARPGASAGPGARAPRSDFRDARAGQGSDRGGPNRGRSPDRERGPDRYREQGGERRPPRREFAAPRAPETRAPESSGERKFPKPMRRVEGPPLDRKPLSAEAREYLPLRLDKGRYKESRFILEGAKNISDAISISPAIIHAVLISEEFKDKDLAALIKKNRISAVHVTMDDIRALSETETPQGILAIANFATLRPDWNTIRHVTLLDAVQDPGNVGAIFRTSLALGMDAIVAGKGTCDPYNPKVVRSSVGALLRLPFETGEDLGSKIAFLRQKNFSIVATSSHAQLTLDQAKLRKKVALIVGNEGAGTGASYLDMADTVVKIPIKNKVESLNVSVAHGILVHQLLHDRT